MKTPIIKMSIGQVVRDLNYYGPIFMRSSNKPRKRGKRPRNSYRSSPKGSAEEESDQFIYEGLSNVERFSIHRSKQYAYGLANDKIMR